MSGGRGGRYNFPNWNYGYTLGPPTAANGGDYTQFVMAQPPVAGGIIGPEVPSPDKGKKGGATDKSTETSTASTANPTPASSKEDKAKNDVVVAAAESSEKKPGDKPEGVKEDGEIIERPINEILRGRNPIMYCNDQSKLRNLHMEWEQVSETGPPHDKIFTWSLKMGEMMTMGSANSKKGGKNKAAEEMVKKLDQLPKLNMKRHFHQAFGHGPPFMMRGGMRGRGRGGFYGAMPPPPHFFAGGGGGGGPHFPKKPKKTEEDSAKPDDAAAATAATEAKAKDDKAKPLHPAQNNPISLLYELTKKRKLPEPLFEVVQEEVLETRKTTQGFTYKKTKFTIQVDIMGKKYLGESMNKKTAKFNSAAAAWADIGAGVGQASIDNLLASGRKAAEAAAAIGGPL